MSWYAVYPGYRPGIYSEWYGPNGALQASSGYPGEKHPSFISYDEAVAWYIKQILGIVESPKWVTQVDIEPEQIKIRISSNSGKSSGRASGNKIDVGRWGEEATFRYFIKQLTQRFKKAPNFVAEMVEESIFCISSGNDLQVALQWRNFSGESGSSPDLILAEDKVEKFIEVKSTESHNNDFSMTPNEWEQAEEKGENFCLVLVRSANTQEATISEIWNPYLLFTQGRLSVKNQDKGSDRANLEIGESSSNSSVISEQAIKPKKLQKDDLFQGRTYVEGIGRRKSSTARARLYVGGNGNFVVNGQVADKYFTRVGDLSKLIAPLANLDMDHEMDMTILVKGGGVNGQLYAAQLGIARALVFLRPDCKSVLRQSGLLTRDAREKERKKPGLKRARKAPTYTKR